MKKGVTIFGNVFNTEKSNFSSRVTSFNLFNTYGTVAASSPIIFSRTQATDMQLLTLKS